MITGFILQIIYSVMAFVVSFLPESAYPTQITDAVLLFWGTMQSFSWLFPMGTLVTVIGIATLYYVSSIAWKFGNMMMRYLRGN